MIDVREDYIKKASEFLALNKECYLAQWILQNPDKNIANYWLVQHN